MNVKTTNQLMMTKEKFKRLIEAPINQSDDKMFARYAIARTMRLTLEHIELAKEYYEELPKATMDSEKPTISKLV